MSRPDPESIKALAGLDKLIHEPGRLAIMSYLSVIEEADFLFLLDQTGLTRGNLSAHMSKLERAGYVAIEKAFIEKTPRTTYRLTEEGRAAFERYRAGLLGGLEGVGG